jgi:homoserine dehydrogenase
MKAKPVLLLQLGLGQVGRALVRHYLARATAYPNLRYLGLGDRHGLWIVPEGWNRAALEDAVDFKNYGMPITRWHPEVLAPEAVPAPDAFSPDLLWRLDELGLRRAIIIDATGPGSGTAPMLALMRREGYDVVLANKAPLAGAQAEYDALCAPAKGRLRWASALGAPLPLGEMLQRAAHGGDTVQAIVAMCSPALGWIMTAVGQGRLFSDAVREAGSRGLLPGDIREHLSGQDTARTALLLARALGQRLEPGEVHLQPLLPAGFEGAAPGEIWQRLGDLDRFFAERAWLAGERGHVLHYLAQIKPDGVTAGLEEVPQSTALGRLAGDESYFAFYTEHGGERPTQIQGRSAGPAATAAAVFADVVSLL